MIITQNQYEDYVRAEDAWYKRIFTISPLTDYNTVRAAWPNIDGVTPLKEIYRQLNTLGPNSTPIDRLNVRQTVNSLLYSSELRSLITSEPFLESLDIELKSIINSIQNAATGDRFVPPANSPANFYQTYIEQQINPPSSPVPSSGGSTTPSTTTPPTESSSTSPVPNCYEKNGVVMTIGSESFHLKLLPAIQSNIPMQGSSEAPNTAPGLHIKIIPNLARLRIPGFAPVYQHLGIDSALVTLVGTFVPEDGENAESFTNVTGFAPPANINDETAFNQVRNSELERSSYAAATKFYDFAVKTGGEVSVYINVPENVNLDSNPFVLNKRPGFKGIIKSMDLFHRNRYRTWYTIQFEVSDFGMYSSTPLDMNQDINEAIQNQVATETQDRAEEDQTTLTERIDNKELISYNDAENPGYFRSGDSYYFRFADPESCRRTFLSVNVGTTVRCDDEQWVELSNINEEGAIYFARERIPPVGATINYPSYETVRDIRRNGYEQSRSDGTSIRQVDGSDVTGVEQANIAIQGSICAVSSFQALAAAGVTGFAAASGVGAPAAPAGAATTIGLGAAAAASCGSWLVSSVKTFTEVTSGAPDTNEGIFEGVVLPIGIDLGTGLVGRAAAPVVTPLLKKIPGPIGNFFRGTSAAVDEVPITPPGTSQIKAPLDPPPASPINPPDPTPPPPPASSASNSPVSNSRPVTAPPDPAPSSSNSPPPDFTPPTSSAVSAVTTTSSEDIPIYYRSLGGIKNPRLNLFFGRIMPSSFNQVMIQENISIIKLDYDGIRFPLKIDNNGILSGPQEAIDIINNNRSSITGSVWRDEIILFAD